MAPSPPSLPDGLPEEVLRLLRFPEGEQCARLEELCAAHPAHGDSLRAWYAEVVGKRTTEPYQPTEAMAVGDVVGPYRVLSMLGEGGMGVVYLAEQKVPVRRRVALKVIKLGMDSKEVLARFEAERQALAMMEHGHIARIFEAGLTERGQPYFAMEYVKGEPITLYCDQNKVSLEERLELFCQVCSGVQHAHNKGVLHRDLTPNNVLVTVQDGRPSVKIIDFGLARATDHRLVEATIFTERGRIIGTPEYMSPEQASPGNLDIDTRTDVYTLGVLLYELLVSELPFPSRELRAAGLLELQRKIREDDPPRPSTRLSTSKGSSAQTAARRRLEPGTLVRQLRDDLDWIVMKALEKDRTRRYETVNAFASDVRRFLAHEPVLAGPPSAVYRVRKFVQRYRMQVAAATMVLLALVAGVVGTSIGLLQAGAAADALRTERDLALHRSYSANLFAARAALDSGDAAETRARLEACPEQLRGFEWRHLKLRSDTRIRSLRIGNAAPAAIAFAPDGTRIAAESSDGVKVLSWPGGEIVRELAGSQLMSVLAWNPESTRLVAPSVDLEDSRSTLCVWEVDTGRVVTRIPQPGVVTDVSYSSDGRRIRTVVEDGTIRKFDAETGDAIPVPAVPAIPRSATCLSPDGTRAARRADWAGPVRVWDMASSEELATFPERWYSLAWRYGSRTLIAIRDRKLWNLDVLTGQSLEIARVSDSLEAIEGVSRDGSLVVTRTGDELRLHGTGVTQRLRGHTAVEGSVAFSADGSLLACPADGSIDVWEGSTRDPVVNVSVQVGALQAVDPEGTRVAGVGLREPVGTPVYVFDLQTGASIHLNSVRAVRSLAFLSRDRLVVGGYDGSLGVWDLPTGTIARELPSTGGPVVRMLADSSGRLVTWSLRGEQGEPPVIPLDPPAASRGLIQVWDVERSELVARVDSDALMGVAFDGPRLVWITSASINVLDLRSGKPVTRHMLSSEVVDAVIEHERGRALAWLLRRDGDVAVVDVADGHSVRAISTRDPGASGRAKSAPISLAVNPDRTRLAVGFQEDLLLLELASGERLDRFAVGGSEPLRFVAGGRRLIAGFHVIDSDPSRARALWRAQLRDERATWIVARAFSELVFPELVSDALKRRHLPAAEEQHALAKLSRFSETQCRELAFRPDVDRTSVSDAWFVLTNRSVEIGPHHDEYRRGLLEASTRGMVLYRLGNASGALEALDHAIAATNALGVFDLNPSILGFRALAAAALGRGEEARRDAAALAELMKKVQFAEIPWYRMLADEVARVVR